VADLRTIGWQEFRADRVHFLHKHNTTQEVDTSSTPVTITPVDASAESYLTIGWQEFKAERVHVHRLFPPGAFDDSAQGQQPTPEPEAAHVRYSPRWRPPAWVRAFHLYRATAQDLDGAPPDVGTADGTEPSVSLRLIAWQQYQVPPERLRYNYATGAYDESANIEPDTFTPVTIRPEWRHSLGNPPLRTLAYVHRGSVADEGFVCGQEHPHGIVSGKWTAPRYSLRVLGYLQHGIPGDDSAAEPPSGLKAIYIPTFRPRRR